MEDPDGSQPSTRNQDDEAISRREVIAKATAALASGAAIGLVITSEVQAQSDGSTSPPSGMGLLVILWDPDEPPSEQNGKKPQRPQGIPQAAELDDMRFFFISGDSLNHFEITDHLSQAQRQAMFSNEAGRKITMGLGRRWNKQTNVIHAMYGELGNGQPIPMSSTLPAPPAGHVYAAEATDGDRIEDVISHHPDAN